MPAEERGREEVSEEKSDGMSKDICVDEEDDEKPH